MRHGERKARLEALLLGRQDLWRPQPFRAETPEWCAAHPALTETLLGLDDDEVAHLEGDNAGLIGLLGHFVPELAELAGLIDFPPSPLPPRGGGAFMPSPLEGEGGAQRREWGGATSPRLYTDIPGRKQAQIAAYAAALDAPRAPVLEWCAGKGHLGRLLAKRWHWPVASLEIDADLCQAGEDLARRAGVDCMQHFVRADALAEDSPRHLAGRHAVALHACGDLHTRLVAGAVAQASPALDLAPCCYYRTVDDTYRPFNPTELVLSHDDLRLAVTETVTASARQRRQSRRALAWKLAWVELRRDLTGETGYTPFPPVPEAWLRDSFAGFVGHMLARAGLPTAGEVDAYEARGQARAERMLRLQLVRLAFRRPLEVWLVMDMAVYLEAHGYAVRVAPFCPAEVTPRNLLLSAQRYT